MKSSNGCAQYRLPTATPAATANSNVSPRVMAARCGIGAVAISGWGWFVSAELTAERA